MTDRMIIQLYRLTDQIQTKKTNKEIFGPTLQRFFIFCQHTISTFAKPHKPEHNPSFAKELTLLAHQILLILTLKIDTTNRNRTEWQT
jgi:hypothetical protein